MSTYATILTGSPNQILKVQAQEISTSSVYNPFLHLQTPYLPGYPLLLFINLQSLVELFQWDTSQIFPFFLAILPLEVHLKHNMNFNQRVNLLKCRIWLNILWCCPRLCTSNKFLGYADDAVCPGSHFGLLGSKLQHYPHSWSPCLHSCLYHFS